MEKKERMITPVDRRCLPVAMLYRAIVELKDMDLITSDGGFRLTDAGKIARL